MDDNCNKYTEKTVAIALIILENVAKIHLWRQSKPKKYALTWPKIAQTQLIIYSYISHLHVCLSSERCLNSPSESQNARNFCSSSALHSFSCIIPHCKVCALLSYCICLHFACIFVQHLLSKTKSFCQSQNKSELVPKAGFKWKCLYQEKIWPDLLICSSVFAGI